MDGAPTVLVVEDEYFIAMMVQGALTDAGFEVVMVGNAQQAISRLNDGKVAYRALVTDINGLGEIDGWAIAKVGREIDPTLPVVYVSAAPASDWRTSGVPDSLFISKPFAPAQVVNAVSQLINAIPPATKE
jgi:DNA-binding response OmpR family regulator